MNPTKRRSSRSAELEIAVPHVKSRVWIGPSDESPLLEWHIALSSAPAGRHDSRGDCDGSVQRDDASAGNGTGVEARRRGARLHAAGIRWPHVSSEGSGGAARGDRVVSEGVHRRMNG